jgi:hypothetical protein
MGLGSVLAPLLIALSGVGIFFVFNALSLRDQYLEAGLAPFGSNFAPKDLWVVCVLIICSIICSMCIIVKLFFVMCLLYDMRGITLFLADGVMGLQCGKNKCDKRT